MGFSYLFGVPIYVKSTQKNNKRKQLEKCSNYIQNKHSVFFLKCVKNKVFKL